MRFSTFSSLEKLLSERARPLDTYMHQFQEKFTKFSEEHAKSLQLSLNRLLPVQEQRVDMVFNELLQLNSIEKRAFFIVYRETQKKQFMGASGGVKFADNPLETGDLWPSNHPRNLQLQHETQQSGLIGLHGLPAEFLAKLESGEAYQKLEDVEVSAAGATEAKVETKVEEVKEEKTSFNLVLKGFAPDAKLKVIKEVKTMLNLGLKEAKDKVEGTAKEPLLLYKNVSKESVKAAFEKLTAAGAQIEWT